MRSAVVIVWLLLSAVSLAQTNTYLFVGHTRSDFQTVVWPLEHVTYERYETVMLGGDYLWDTTRDDQSMRYLDAIYDLDRPATLIAYGNHDDTSGTRFKNYTGREFHYTYATNGVHFVVLNTEEDPGNIPTGQLAMLSDVVNNAAGITDLILIKHRILWMVNNPDLQDLLPHVATTTQNLGSSNWFAGVHPLLVQAEQAGIEVVCLAGDRTNVNIDYARDGVTYLASGIKEEFAPTNNFVVTLTQDVKTGTMSYAFDSLDELPTSFPPIVFNEIHFQPGGGQRAEHEFIEVLNFGETPYDLNGCEMISGVVFSFTNATVLAPGERLLLVRDASLHTAAPVPVFEWEAGDNLLNGGDLIALVDPDGRILDAVSYDPKTSGTDQPWPSAPFGGGPSLALLNPHRDNVWPGNWRVSEQDGGTPGSENFDIPRLAAVRSHEGATVMQWGSTVGGVSYALEGTPNLQTPNWQLLGMHTAVASGLSITNSPVSSERLFYRLGRIFP